MKSTFGTGIGLMGIDALIIAYIIIQAIFIRKVYGFTLLLLVLIFLQSLCTITSNSVLLTQYVFIFNNRPEDCTKTYEKYQDTFEWVCSFSFAFSYSALWIFAIKYWDLSLKLELIQKKDNINKYEKRSALVFWVGLAFCILAGICIG